MSSELYIVGTGGLAKECAQLARQIDSVCERWHAIKYVTHDDAILGTTLPFGCISMLDHELHAKESKVDVVIGIGHPQLKQKICQDFLKNPSLSYPNLIHPSVDIDSNFVNMGCGNIVTKGVIMTCDIKIGNFNLFNWNCTIGHDSEIGNYNVINPGSSVSGRVKIGDSCLIGTGARIIENINIGSNIQIGAGAVMTRSSVLAGVYVGIPARLKESS
jgi:sugar O-acyltransferase (sialic acid O-acetyltransferase NeuD family)